ncbi:MAG: phosphatidylglycerophosphatase A [Alphaproteobacteria bacterium]|nr:phosphatidylglycerophosphatase A [Alphaproteobacteria bacterium]MCB9928338.1 phosphatidylglycerophosphatase A [Alphaproteobacteria bacterium]
MIAKLLATWFGSGLLPKAPGTWGSLAALPPGLLLLWAGGVELLAIGTLAVSLAGIWAGGRYAAALGRDDPGAVVIDEVAGLWLALLPCAALAPLEIALAFLLFRAADILKPWPASWADRTLPGGLGIMADDWIAGVYAALALVLLQSGGLV